MFLSLLICNRILEKVQCVSISKPCKLVLCLKFIDKKGLLRRIYSYAYYKHNKTSWIRLNRQTFQLLCRRPPILSQILETCMILRCIYMYVHSLMFYGVQVIGEFPYFSMVKSYNHRCHIKNLYGTSGWKVIQPLVPYKKFIWQSYNHWCHINFLYGTSGCMTFQPQVPYKIFVWHQWLYDFPKLLMNAIH